METVSIITDLVLIGLLIIYIIRDLRTTTKAKRNQINIYFSRSNHPSPLDPQTSIKDANEIAGKSAAKDAERIARLEKEVDTLIREKNEQFDRITTYEEGLRVRSKMIEDLNKREMINMNTINRLTAENDELLDRVRELEGRSKTNNKHAKTPPKNAASGK